MCSCPGLVKMPHVANTQYSALNPWPSFGIKRVLRGVEEEQAILPWSKSLLIIRTYGLVIFPKSSNHYCRLSHDHDLFMLVASKDVWAAWVSLSHVSIVNNPGFGPQCGHWKAGLADIAVQELPWQRTWSDRCFALEPSAKETIAFTERQHVHLCVPQMCVSQH